MQILRWLFEAAHEQGTQIHTSSPTNKNIAASDRKAKPKDIILVKDPAGAYQRSKCREGSKPGSKDFTPFRFLCRKGIARACFYDTLHLKRVSSFNSRTRKHLIQSMKMKKEDVAQGESSKDKVDSATHAGNKVLPITDTVLSSSSSKNDQCSTTGKKDRLKGDKTKAMSRMKELLRWAATAKTEKGGKFIGGKVMQFRNQPSLKASADDDHLGNIESPKISFRRDMDTFSTISSTCSENSMASLSKTDEPRNMLSLNSVAVARQSHCSSRRGNWITTDSEFVVLEL